MAVLGIKPMRYMVRGWLSLQYQIPRKVYNNLITFNWANKRLFASVYKHVSLQMTWSWKRFTAAIIGTNEWSFTCVLSHMSFKFVCTSKWPATPLRTKKEGNEGKKEQLTYNILMTGSASLVCLRKKGCSVTIKVHQG